MLKEGLIHTSKVTVAPANCASAVGAGGLDVFATPSMVALMENAAMNAVAPFLPEGSTTVGTAMQTSHVKASKMGAMITASARLVEVDGRRLRFEVRAWDEAGTIGEGEHTRFVVDRERFLAKL